MKRNVVLAGVGILMALGGWACAGTRAIDYPEGYRQWSHIKSMVIEPGHPLENPFQGLHHVYGNGKALEGYQNGEFPQGSVIVFDLLNYKKADKTVQEADRKLIGVMVKDDSAYAETGGWGFEAFAGDSRSKRLVEDKGQGCFACHASQKENGFVFSKLRK